MNAVFDLNRNIGCINETKDILLGLENLCLFYFKESESLKNSTDYLQEVNLELEVEKFGHVQDTAMLETRLLKYHALTKSYEDYMCSLKCELTNLRAQNHQYLKINTTLKQQVATLNTQFQHAQKVSEQIKTMHQSYLILQQANDELQLHLDQTQQELARETKINQIDTERIEELHQLLGKRTLEMNSFAEKFYNAQKTLDATLHENQTLKKQVQQTQERLQDFQQANAVIGERTDHCQKEIEAYRDELDEMKSKFAIMKDLLQKRNGEYTQLETQYHVAKNNLECVRKQNEINKNHYEEDLGDLKHTIRELNDKLIKSEANYQGLHEDYKRSQAQVISMTKREAKLQQQNALYEQQLLEKSQMHRCEESCLKERLKQFKSETDALKNELLVKQREIELMKAQLNRLTSSATSQVAIAQEEINSLKNDLNRIIQQHNLLKKENERLQNEVCHFQACTTHNDITNQQLEQSLIKLQAVQLEKEQADEQNQRLLNEIKLYEIRNRDLGCDNQTLIKSVTNLQQDLYDMKVNRDELCNESQNVLENVKAWLQNQALINNRLSGKIKNDHDVINGLRRQILALHTIKNKHMQRQRGGGSRLAISKQSHKSLWTLNRSGSVSPTTSVNSAKNTYTYECDDSDEDDLTSSEQSPSWWLRRIENITEKVEKTNKYWQSKMLDNDYMVTRDQ